MSRITARDTPNWRRSPEEITKLARECITNQCLVTNDKRAIESAFYLVLSFISMTEAASKQVGALIGYYNDVVPKLGMNGYPIFLSVGFLHKADVPAFEAELERMRAALEPAGS